MLINFIGGPHSGKTTLTAKLFEHFKSQNIVCEFISEKAREYIAEKRLNEKLILGQKLYLTDEDQIKIMRKQLEVEKAFVFSSSKETLVLSDSSPLNTLLYLSDKVKATEEVKTLVQESLDLNPLVFWTRVIAGSNSLDVNRIHDPIVCSKIDSELSVVKSNYFPQLEVKELRGPTSERFLQVLNKLLNLWGIE